MDPITKMRKPVINLSNVIYCSSKDSEFPAENALKGCVIPWKCSERNKSGQLVGEFELECLNQIAGIRICNYNSHTIEISVGRYKKSKTQPQEYRTYLPTFTMYSPDAPREPPRKGFIDDSKKGLTSVFEFDQDHFVPALFKKKWNIIKVILTNAEKNVEFGLSYFRLYSEEKPIDDYTDLLNLSIKCELENMAENFSADDDDDDDDTILGKNYSPIMSNIDLPSCSNGKNPSKKSSPAGSLAKAKKVSVEKEKINNFKAEVRKFLKKERNQVYFHRFVDYLDEFELESEYPVTLEQKRIFYDLYAKIIGESKYDNKDRFFALEEVDYQDDIYEGIIPKCSTLLENFIAKNPGSPMSIAAAKLSAEGFGSSKKSPASLHASTSKKSLKTTKSTMAAKKSFRIKSSKKLDKIKQNVKNRGKLFGKETSSTINK